MTDDVALIPPDSRGANVANEDPNDDPIWASDNFYVKSLAIFNKPEDILTRKQALALTTYLVNGDATNRRAEEEDSSLKKTWWFVMLDNW